MSAGITPGPWKLETESRSADGSDLLVTTTDGAWNIADCRDHGGLGVDSVEEAEANARLIAAAPALRDALRRLVGVFDWAGVNVETSNREAAKELTEAFAQAGAALKQAEAR
jgi:hypothetical protein